MKNRLLSSYLLDTTLALNVVKTQDDYIAGPHHFWTHFWCGLVAGACVGAGLGWQICDSREAILATSVGVSLIEAFSCGRWGDQAWKCFAKLLSWF